VQSEPPTPILDPFVTPQQKRGPTLAELEQEAQKGPPTTSGSAIAAMIFAVLGYTCLPAVGGLLALVFGIAAKGEIARSNGERTGSTMSILAMVFGGLNVVASVAALGLFLAYLPSSSSSTSSSPSPTPYSPRYPVPSPIPTAAPPPPLVSPSANSGASRDNGVISTTVGAIDLIDVGNGVRSLNAELDNQRTIAQKDQKKLVLWVVMDDCQPCNGVAASLSDPKLQSALSGVRLVRVNVRDFAADLRYLGIPSDKFPGFVLLGPTNRPVDYVNGGEWDEDVPRNIAPVLGNFVKGSYTKRREPWRGIKRDDETTL
jgi:hypothetical protein